MTFFDFAVTTVTTPSNFDDKLFTYLDRGSKTVKNSVKKSEFGQETAKLIVLNICLAIFGQQPTVNGKLVDRSAINHFTSLIKVPTVQVSILDSIFSLGSTVGVKTILACL